MELLDSQLADVYEGGIWVFWENPLRKFKVN